VHKATVSVAVAEGRGGGEVRHLGTFKNCIDVLIKLVPGLWWFLNKVKRLWLASLKRRSQRARVSWERFIRLVARFFPPIRTLHPLPCNRFDAKTRGWSPVR
jgi:hypothetical protein